MDRRKIQIPEGQTIKAYIQQNGLELPTLKQIYEAKGAQNWTARELGQWQVQELLNCYRKNPIPLYISGEEFDRMGLQIIGHEMELIRQGKTSVFTTYGQDIRGYIRLNVARGLEQAHRGFRALASMREVFERCADHERAQDVGRQTIFNDRLPSGAREYDLHSPDIVQYQEYIKAHGIAGFTGDKTVYSAETVEYDRGELARAMRWLGCYNFVLSEMGAFYGLEDIDAAMIDNSGLKSEARELNKTLEYLRQILDGQDITNRQLRRVFRRVEYSDKPAFKKDFLVTSAIISGLAFRTADFNPLYNIAE